MDEITDISQRFTEFFYSVDGPNKRKVLVASKYSERTKVNICLLRFFLHEMKKKGIFITIDQPHQYIESLLKIHNISQEDLLYIDAISRISGEKESNVSNVRYINGPYAMDFLDDISSISCATSATNKQVINLEEMDFILIDDIAALTKYQEEDGVKQILSSYMACLNGLKNITAAIVLDVNQNKYIYDLIVEKCDRILLINLSKSIFKEVLDVHPSNATNAAMTLAIAETLGKITVHGDC